MARDDDLLARGAAGPFALALALLGAAVVLGLLAADRDLLGRTEGVPAVVALVAAIAVVLLAREARKDPLPVAGLAAAAGVVVLLIFGAVAFFGAERHPFAASAAASGALAFVAGTWTVWRLRGPGPWPDVLGEHFGSRGYAEMDAVQFKAVLGADDVGAGAPVPLVVFLQNPLDVGRQVHLHLQPDRGSPIVAMIPYLVPLAPGEVAVVRLTLRTAPGAAGLATGRLWLRAVGDGRRVRRQRGEAVTPPGWSAGRLLRLLLALVEPARLVALVLAPGGVSVGLVVHSSPPTGPPVEHASTVETLWLPERRTALVRGA